MNLEILKETFRQIRRYTLRHYIESISKSHRISNLSSLIIAAHPDDEVFGCGGLIAAKRAMNCKVYVIYLTDGEASHRNCCNTDLKDVGDIRKKLAIESGKILGLRLEDMFWLGIPDGNVPFKETPSFQINSKKLLEIISSVSPDEIYSHFYLDCWPDHEASSEIVRSALLKYKAKWELYYYPIWMWHNLRFRSLPKILKTKILRVDISSFLGKKRTAIEYYLSASSPDCGISFCGNLPNGFVEHFQYDYEIFFKA